jgi:hypothetical protein
LGAIEDRKRRQDRGVVDRVDRDRAFIADAEEVRTVADEEGAAALELMTLNGVPGLFTLKPETPDSVAAKRKPLLNATSFEA